MEKNFIKQLAWRLSQPKPGLGAQLKMITRPRLGHQVYTEVEGKSQPAAVLILLYPRADSWHLALTLRTEKVEAHRSQISLPGGRQEEGESLAQTALRETQEELGLDPQKINILGQLTPLYIPTSNYCLYPFVGVLREPPPVPAFGPRSS